MEDNTNDKSLKVIHLHIDIPKIIVYFLLSIL